MSATPLLLTVDVEGVVADDAYHSVELLDDLLSDLALPVTLFVTPAVLEARDDTVRRWVDRGHTVGLHVHPARMGGESDWLETYDQAAIESFLERGVAAFERHVSHRPRAFRAGRWSFSEALVPALRATGFDRDASVQPTRLRGPYTVQGVREYPLSVYGSALFRTDRSPWDVEGVPLSLDALLASGVRSPLCYVATWRLLRARPPYLMVALHDYDLTDEARYRRVRRYLARVSEWTRPTTLDGLTGGQGRNP